jgi:hypothetical protein
MFDRSIEMRKRLFENEQGPSNSDRGLLFYSDSAPVGHMTRKLDLAKPSFGQHLLDLLSRKSLLKSGAEPVVGIGAHHIEFSMTIGFKWYGGWLESRALDQRCNTRQWPIDENQSVTPRQFRVHAHPYHYSAHKVRFDLRQKCLPSAGPDLAE